MHGMLEECDAKQMLLAKRRLLKQKQVQKSIQVPQLPAWETGSPPERFLNLQKCLRAIQRRSVDDA